MGTITAIEAQKKRGNRRSIFVDGEFVAGAHEDVILTLGLAVGQTFDRDRLADLLKAETARKARASAIRLIGYRDRSRSEIRRRLIGDDFPEEIVDEVIDHLTRSGLLNDDRFSRDWIKARSASKPMGKTRLAWELRSKGVEADTVDEALEEIDEGAEYEHALSVASQKLRKMDCADPLIRNRLGSFLRRRGFGWEIISKVIDELCPSES